MLLCLTQECLVRQRVLLAVSRPHWRELCFPRLIKVRFRFSQNGFTPEDFGRLDMAKLSEKIKITLDECRMLVLGTQVLISLQLELADCRGGRGFASSGAVVQHCGH
jgi:hypothetical protein